VQHEIRKSGGDKCVTCGSYELIHIEPHHEPLMRLIGRANYDAPWWRPFKRKWLRQVTREMNQIQDDFIQKTRFPIVESPLKIYETDSA
jgi:hypothetical protein